MILPKKADKIRVIEIVFIYSLFRVSPLHIIN